MSRFVIIDGHSQIYRALYSKTSSDMVDGEGNKVGGVFAFFRIFDSLIETLKPDYLLVALDGPRRDLVRRQEFPAYKATRKTTPGELAQQAARIIDILDTLGIPTYSIKGWEADDIIATLVDICARPRTEVVIVTRDKDLQQVLRPGVVIYEPMKGDWIDQQTALDNWKVPVDKIIEIQCLMGDTVDNVPGVPGVGKVKALKLIEQYGTARNVWQNRSNFSGRLKRSLDEFDIDLGYRLVTMRTDLRINLVSRDLEWVDYDLRKKRQVFGSMGAMMS